MLEIERKFLTLSDAFKTEAKSSYRIKQGFLNRNPERTVRIRLKGEQGFLTVKGKSSDDGLSRYEWEKELSKADAEAKAKALEAEKAVNEARIAAAAPVVEEEVAEETTASNEEE